MNNFFHTVILFSLLTAAGLVPVLCRAQGTWERCDIPTGRFLRDMSFTDSLTGWIAADSGMILHTNDGGLSWDLQETGTYSDVVAIFFLDKKLGWASCNNYKTVPYGTELLKTRDGGVHWTKTNYPVENIFMTCIQYFDSLNGWMGGKPHALVRTHDGGVTWYQAAIDTSTLAFFPVLNINFLNERIGYAGGGMFDIAGVVWRTTDGGNRWSAIDPVYAPADEVHALHIFDSLNVLGAGGDPDFGYGVGMIRTYDGGEQWSYMELGVQGNAYDLSFRNDSEVWAPLGPQRKMIVSMDAGVTWTAFPTPDSSLIYRAVFPDTLHGYAIGAAGALLKYKPKSVGINPEKKMQPGYVLKQNFPNPFRNETTISFTVPEGHGMLSDKYASGSGKEVVIRVYDLYGTLIISKRFGNPVNDQNQMQIDGASLVPGVYFYRLEELGNLQVRTMPLPRKMVKY